MATRTLELIGYWLQALSSQYLGSREFSARLDSSAALALIFTIDSSMGFPLAFRLAYVFPVCLAARGAGARWSLGIVLASALVLALAPGHGSYKVNAPLDFLMHAAILGTVLRLVRRLETGLSTYQNLATRDPLTELPNRTALERYGARAVRHAARTGQAMSVAMIDLDGFKRLNDTYGHAHGDLVLKIVAMCLTRSLRPNGFVARTGGDEFVVVLPGADRVEAEMLLDRVVARFHETTLGDHAGTGLSFGISEYRSGDTLELLLADADHRMYARKRTGARRLL